MSTSPYPQTIGLEASKVVPCPLCGHEHYCYLVQNEQGEIFKAICQWTSQPPSGWQQTSTAKDGRGVFTKLGFQQKRRKHYPDLVRLSPALKDDIPQWQDYLLDMSGDRLKLQRDGKQREQAIEYFYPNELGQPVGKVVRCQWTDRRRVYENNRKTKHVRPWHWVNSAEGGFWSDRGKGSHQWGVYRETEAKDEILRGGVVFAVAGEQAVEAYRKLGLTATTCQGGESNWRQIVDRLKDAFATATADGLRPVLIVHPDHDLTGEGKFADLLTKECVCAKIPAVAIEPLRVWDKMPAGGDIWDWVNCSGLEPVAILRTLEAVIDEAIDFAESEIQSQQQRSRWKAPEAYQGELGYWVKVKKSDERTFCPKTDFDFQVVQEVASDDGGGYLLEVKRADDRHQQRVFLKSTEFGTAQKFEDALKRSLKVGVICNLANHEVGALLRVRLHEYRLTRRGRVFRLVDRVGQQQNGYWVFRDRQYTPQGETCAEGQSLWVWNSKLTGEESTLPNPRLNTPNSTALKEMVAVMKRAFASNFMPSLLALGYAAAGVHYQQIMDAEGAFPTLNLYGDPGSGKTSAAECALALVGMHQDGMMSAVTISAAYERLKLSGGLVHCLDDPARSPDLNSFLKGFYNGKPRIVRDRERSFNLQRPHSPLMVTSNFGVGESDPATQSRLVRLFFAKRNDGLLSAFHELAQVQSRASACLPDLIRLGYPAEEVYQLQSELVRYLPNAHIRIAKSLALITYYAMKVAAMAELEPQALKAYVIETVCTSVNDPEEDGDSIRDFLEKVHVLEAQSHLGKWNMRWIDKADGSRVLALHIPSVWKCLDREFELPYNRKVIECLLKGQGIKETRQRFHKSEDESKAHARACLTSGAMGPNSPEEVTRFCYEIPAGLLQSVSDKVQPDDLPPPVDQQSLPSDTQPPLVDLAISTSKTQTTSQLEPLAAAPVDLVDLVDRQNAEISTDKEDVW